MLIHLNTYKRYYSSHTFSIRKTTTTTTTFITIMWRSWKIFMVIIIFFFFFTKKRIGRKNDIVKAKGCMFITTLALVLCVCLSLICYFNFFFKSKNRQIQSTLSILSIYVPTWHYTYENQKWRQVMKLYASVKITILCI